ncbi:paramyosin-related protein-like [Dorcoceras hygrometricum]|nr:paramyosin-related protein-like [Dorcoceras hygrometricum]
MPTTTIDLQVLDMLSGSHCLALSTLVDQMRQHQLEWTRPSFSSLLEGANVQRGAVIARSHTTIKSICWIRRLLLINGSWTVIEGADRWIHECKTTNSCEQQQLSQRPFVDEFSPICIFVEPVQDLGSQPPIIKTWDAFAQLRATVDQISMEQVQTRFHLDEHKVALSKRISNLETAFLTASDNQDRVVLAQTNVVHKEMQPQKDALSKELDAMQNFQTLSTHLSEIIAYFNRGRDDKKGEISSSEGPQPTKIKADLDLVVEVGANLQGKDVVDLTEEE